MRLEAAHAGGQRAAEGLLLVVQHLDDLAAAAAQLRIVVSELPDDDLAPSRPETALVKPSCRPFLIARRRIRRRT